LGDTALAAKYNPNMTCFECYKKGHIAMHCPKQNAKGNCGNNKKKNFREHWKKKNLSKSDQAHQASEDYAFFADPTSQQDIALPVLTANLMLADCAAASHIFHDHTCFSSYVTTLGH
jgi:hypothetical protein